MRNPFSWIVLLCLSIGPAPQAFAESRVVDIHGIGPVPLGAEPSRVIDLGLPGALNALAHDNPRHYEKIMQIMSGVQSQPDSEIPRWMHARFDARNVFYGPLLLVTHPPKRQLSFTIDDVRYQALVTLRNWNPRLTPAK